MGPGSAAAQQYVCFWRCCRRVRRAPPTPGATDGNLNGVDRLKVTLVIPADSAGKPRGKGPLGGLRQQWQIGAFSEVSARGAPAVLNVGYLLHAYAGYDGRNPRIGPGRR